ncbi:MAG: class I SAM-dependent methyltransferase [Parcubacteria group bacterium]|nr:class I SAM-dependent methyltransferase [Parcubacteria group bacterium]
MVGSNKMKRENLKNLNTSEFMNRFWKSAIDNNQLPEQLGHYENEVLEYIGNEQSVLDVGCGVGKFLNYLATNFENMDLCGVDISEVAIDYAKNNYSDKITFLTIDNIKDFDPRKMYDIIVLHQILEHMEDPENFLKEVLKHLKVSGKVIISVPNANFSYDANHLWSFVEDDLKKLLSDFKDITIKTIDSSLLVNDKSIIIATGIENVVSN